MLNPLVIERIVRTALEEDLGAGDVTTLSIVPQDLRAGARIITREDGIIAGLDVAAAVFRVLDPAMRFAAEVSDGQRVAAGAVVASLEGLARAILSGERVALNFLQRLSGIATRTSEVAEILKYYKTRIVDTRKTTPGLRMLEKYAVRMGGGYNHRMGLADAVLIKDNHIAIAGGIKQAVLLARRGAAHTMRLEVETETLADVEEALEAGADIIMLDNMDLDTMRRAVEIIGGRALVEASGAITPERVLEIARAGVDYISMGCLTHSVRALDLTLEVGPE